MQNVVAGAAFGVVASLFFRKKSVIFYSAGFGLGYTVFTTFR